MSDYTSVSIRRVPELTAAKLKVLAVINGVTQAELLEKMVDHFADHPPHEWNGADSSIRQWVAS